MPQVRRAHNALASLTTEVNINPFQRFGLGGGAVRVRASVATGATEGDVLANLTIGSDQVTRDNAIDILGVVNSETPAMEGVGGPSDPISITLQNTSVTARIVDVVVDIQNVA